MIGQKNLLETIDKLIEKGFPRFVIITGQKGQGKKTIMKEISKKLNIPLILSNYKVDDIREVIKLAYEQTEPVIYGIPDCDKMSLGAKNSLLKIIEEPPNNAYFILTLQQLENTLPTIKSRCQELKMNNYSIDELESFIDLINKDINETEKEFLLSNCDNYYEIELINNYGVQDYFRFVRKVVDNIYKVQSANAFKLTENLALKDDSEGYDLNLFFKTFNLICIDRATLLIESNDSDEEIDFNNYITSIGITNTYKDKLNIVGVNKQSLVDMWILDIRKIWRN